MATIGDGRKSRESRGLDTHLAHLEPGPRDQHGFVNPPVYRGSTALYPSMSALRESLSDPLKLKSPRYGRFGTPASEGFQSALAEMEGGYASVCTGTGLSAVTTSLLALVKSGDHLLISDSVYLPTRAFCESLKCMGVEVEYFNPSLGKEIEDQIKQNTRLVFLESPGSMTFEIQDVPAIVKSCQSRGVWSLIDNTWATPLFFQPLLLGVDISIHSGTKYLSGHSDSYLGVVVCNEKAYAPVRSCALRLGQCAGADDIALGLRGLRTLSLRMKHHEKQGLELALWLQDRPEVTRVLHPAIPSFIGHDYWKRDFKGSSGLFSIILRPEVTRESIDAMIDGMQLFGLGHSWGGFESLIMPFEPQEWRTPGQWQEKGQLLRVHAGLEDIRDLKRDLENGFRKLVFNSER